MLLGGLVDLFTEPVGAHQILEAFPLEIVQADVAVLAVIFVSHVLHSGCATARYAICATASNKKAPVFRPGLRSGFQVMQSR
ncbi:hypothetical protein D3C86_2050400 [compost metagenome]